MVQIAAISGLLSGRSGRWKNARPLMAVTPQLDIAQAAEKLKTSKALERRPP